ncbi:MAG: DNA replication and repair protein RecF [Gemmatimonadales bacterium]|nr:DNA replication and repair protein RecF [Gemmatimonadales bacterium]
MLRLAIRSFRNLADGPLDVPHEGLVLVGPNGHGKSSFLEAVYYPALFRSVRDAADQELVRFGQDGFLLESEVRMADGATHRFRVGYVASPRRKKVEVDGATPLRLADQVGTWLAVAFLPSDVRLASGSAEERRRYVDRTLALASPGYFGALARYRYALAQRNAALRQGREAVARAFDHPLAEHGSRLVRERLAWVQQASGQFAAEYAWLGETWIGVLRYRGRPELGDEGAWPAALDEARAADLARGLTTIGPHRDDLVLESDGRPLRTYGSTGQLRSAAVALKLIELETLARTREAPPALLLDDVFAELDDERQRRLARRLADGRHQVFLSAARADEVPPELAVPRWTVRDGRVAR